MEADRGPHGRPLPWVASDLPLEPIPEGPSAAGRVTGLCMDALRVVGLRDLTEGARLRLAFRLPGQRGPVVVQGRARRLSGDPPVAEVTVEAFEGGGERGYQQYVLSRVGAEAMDRQADALTTPSGRLVPLTDPDRIRELLDDSLAYKADTLVQAQHPAAPVRGLLTGISSSELLLQLETDARSAPLAGTRVRCSLLSRHGPYLFEADVRARADGQLRLSFPERLHQYEKRAEPRTVLRLVSPPGAASEAPDAGVADRIVISLPPAYGGAIERPLIDVGEAGVAFRSRPGDPLFLPGTPLPGVVLLRGGRPGSSRPAEVRQVTLERDDPCSPERTFRVGLALDVERRRVSGAVTRDAASGAIRPGWLERLAAAGRRPLAAASARLFTRRRAAAASAPLVNVVRYRGRHREEIVGLLNSTRPVGTRAARLQGPLIVIPPPFGRTKETFCALALMLVETFQRQDLDAVVVRYDGVRSLGESHKEPEDWAEGRHMMRYTLSQGVADLLATVEHFHTRPWFKPTSTVVVSFSLAALSARRAVLEDQAGRITHWMSIVGAVDAQNAIFNVTGGIDLIGGHQMGLNFGLIPVLGQMGDADAFAADAIASGLATLADARRDLARIRIPVTWFVGRDDRWIRAERVYEAMSVSAPGDRAVVELPIGHTMRSSAEALQSFETITRTLFRQLYGEGPVDVRLDASLLKRVFARERGRLPEHRLGDARQYWEQYLLGEDRRGLGLDLWATTPAYRELMDLQRQLLDVGEGDVVADLGAGTGNFLEHFLDRLVRSGFRTSPRRVIAADLVPAALAVARRKVEAVLEGVLVPADFIEYRELNLDTSRLRPLRRFLAGEFPSVEGLRGLVEGLPDSALDAWLAVYDDRVHAWLRGAAPDGPVRAQIARLLRGQDLEVALEFNRAVRWVLGRLALDDLRSDLDMTLAGAILAEPRSARAEHLRFERLRFDGPGLDDRYPFAEASLDKVLLSLVISYLADPLEVLREVHRILRPGGRAVASTLRPDADMSRTAEELVERVSRDESVARRFGLTSEALTRALQQYLNHAADLVNLEERGVFRFLSREDLARLFEDAGFDQVKVYESAGRPPLVFVGVGVKA